MTGKDLEFEHEITDYEEGVKFGWLGKVVGDVNDHYPYSVHGLHSRLMNFVVKHGISAAYRSFNRELMERIESPYPRNNS